MKKSKSMNEVSKGYEAFKRKELIDNSRKSFDNAIKKALKPVKIKPHALKMQ